MLQGIIEWTSYHQNFIGAGINGIIALVFIITISITKEKSFFDNIYKKLAFWFAITTISFFGAIWIVTFSGKGQEWIEYYTVFNMPMSIRADLANYADMLQLSVPTYMSMAYVALVILLKGKNQLHKLNIKESFVMIYSSMLVTDILHQVFSPLTSIGEGFGGIGGAGHNDVLFMVPIGSFFILGIIKMSAVKEYSESNLRGNTA